MLNVANFLKSLLLYHLLYCEAWMIIWCHLFVHQSCLLSSILNINLNPFYCFFELLLCVQLSSSLVLYFLSSIFFINLLMLFFGIKLTLERVSSEYLDTSSSLFVLSEYEYGSNSLEISFLKLHWPIQLACSAVR